MADTIRTRAALLSTLFQDGQTAGISAQDIRDLIVSLKSVYGSMSVDNASGVNNATVGTSFVLCDVWDTADIGVGVTPDQAFTNYDLDVGSGSDGVFRVDVGLSFGGTGSTQFIGKIHKNGVETYIGFTRLLGTGGDVGVVEAHGFLNLVAGDLVTLRLKADGASKTFTAYQGSMSITRVK